MNELAAFRVHGAPHPFLFKRNEKELFTRSTWEDFLSNRGIPHVLLAIATLETPNNKPVTKIYEATNLREHIKIAGLVDPLTKLPIEKINWVFMRTFNLDNNANVEYPHEYEFLPLDHLPDCFFEPMRNLKVSDSCEDTELPLQRVKEIFLQAFSMEAPLPHDWFTSASTKETVVKLNAEIFSRTCNPSISPKAQAQAQFIAGLSLLLSPECRSLVKEENGQEEDPVAHRTSRSNEGVRYLMCADKNGHKGSSVLMSMLYQGHCGLIPILTDRISGTGKE